MDRKTTTESDNIISPRRKGKKKYNTVNAYMRDGKMFEEQEVYFEQVIPFIKLMPNGIREILTLNKAAQSLLLAVIIPRMFDNPTNDLLSLTLEVTRCALPGATQQTFSRGLSSLVKSEFVKKHSPGTYRANPHYFFIGSAIAQEKAINQWHFEAGDNVIFLTKKPAAVT